MMGTIAELLLALLLGCIAGKSLIYVFNRIPAKWLCDYNETPSKEMWDERISKKKWEPVLMLLFSGVAVFLIGYGQLYFLAAMFALWLLLQIGIADKKYMVIPDQHVIALAVSAIGFASFHTSFYQPLIGALIGGGSFFLVGMIGLLFFKKETVGFGDVKLLLSIGLFAGIKGIILILLIAVFSSALIMGIGLLLHKFKRDEQQPLGPFLAAAAALYLLFPKELDLLFDLLFQTVVL